MKTDGERTESESNRFPDFCRGSTSRGPTAAQNVRGDDITTHTHGKKKACDVSARFPLAALGIVFAPSQAQRESAERRREINVLEGTGVLVLIT
ncbi:hypothetical protein EYF80_024565 [Liparis tanakae]|uniref:Uncharacterized protein n=1 Tax=Liparis tanakae TaxID=230148 RepID=A0A4Z2HHN4_9TELE|nr:hypothetical protein EYF80_024565 [Liparis tanakae]